MHGCMDGGKVNQRLATGAQQQQENIAGSATKTTQRGMATTGIQSLPWIVVVVVVMVVVLVVVVVVVVIV